MESNFSSCFMCLLSVVGVLQSSVSRRWIKLRGYVSRLPRRWGGAVVEPRCLFRAVSFQNTWSVLVKAARGFRDGGMWDAELGRGLASPLLVINFCLNLMAACLVGWALNWIFDHGIYTDSKNWVYVSFSFIPCTIYTLKMSGQNPNEWT
jgi:hypothetical protein